MAYGSGRVLVSGRATSSLFDLIGDVVSDEHDLKRFLNPLTIVFKAIGMPLIHRRTSVYIFKYRVVHLLGWLIFLANIGCGVWTISIMMKNNGNASYVSAMKSSSTISGTQLISILNELLFKWGGHLSLLLLAGSSGQLKLAKTIRRLPFTGLKIRQYSRAILIILLMASLFLSDNGKIKFTC